MGYTVHMRIRTSMLQRVAVVIFASWFAVLTGFVHALHLHPANEYGVETDPVCSTCSSHDMRSNMSVPVEQVKSADGSLWEAQNNLGPCVACLFLKNCKERAISQDPHIPVLIPARHAIPHHCPASASSVIVSSCPRAPPSQII